MAPAIVGKLAHTDINHRLPSCALTSWKYCLRLSTSFCPSPKRNRLRCMQPGQAASHLYLSCLAGIRWRHQHTCMRTSGHCLQEWAVLSQKRAMRGCSVQYSVRAQVCNCSNLWGLFARVGSAWSGQCVVNSVQFSVRAQEWAVRGYSVQFSVRAQEWAVRGYSVQYSVRAQEWAVRDYSVQYSVRAQEWAVRTYRKARPPGDPTKLPEFTQGRKEIELAYG
eukprot:1161515-Pelagomonas_calceolata.AAC.12